MKIDAILFRFLGLIFSITCVVSCSVADEIATNETSSFANWNDPTIPEFSIDEVNAHPDKYVGKTSRFIGGIGGTQMAEKTKAFGVAANLMAAMENKKIAVVFTEFYDKASKSTEGRNKIRTLANLSGNMPGQGPAYTLIATVQEFSDTFQPYLDLLDFREGELHGQITTIVPPALQKTLTKALAGDAEAQYVFGKAFVNGQAGETNYAQAVKWFQKGAAQGNADAQNGLGVMYLHGFGVDQNYAEAMKLFLDGAEKGNAKAQCNMGSMYMNGSGVDRNYVEGVKWYRLSVKQGNADAQYSLGLIYKDGMGVDKNNTEAKRLFQQAADQGNELAKRALQQLTNSP
jgi:hypothetical protein